MNDFHERLDLNDYDFRIIFGRSGIEYDPNKSKRNIQIHGYSLEEAVQLFTSALLFQTQLVSTDPYIRNGEIRQSHMAVYRNRIIHISTTMRPGESIRIISMRPASKKERKIFEESRYLVLENKTNLDGSVKG
jgi:uncharacterized DUF497 family protein